MSEVVLVYDRQCPVCEFYSLKIRVDKAVGCLLLIDARLPRPILDEITALGWDIDQGMVLKIDKELYYGADAIHILSLLAGRVGFFNRVNYFLFKNKNRARFFYPIFRALRNFLLKILGKTRVNNLNLDNHQRF